MTWTKVCPEKMAEALEAMKQAEAEGKSTRQIIEIGNAAIGIKPKARRASHTRTET